MPSARRRPRRHVRVQTQKSAPGYSAKNNTEDANATPNKRNIAMNSLHSNPDDSTGTPQRVTATLHASDLGDQVNLWTDWDHSGGTFPVEYLPEVIAALQAIQTARTESEAKA